MKTTTVVVTPVPRRDTHGFEQWRARVLEVATGRVVADVTRWSEQGARRAAELVAGN